MLAVPLALALASGVRAEDPPVCGDVNDSGTVTSTDALFVLRKSVGQNVQLDCPDFLVRYGFEEDRGFTATWSPDFLFGTRVAVATSVTVTHLGMYARETGSNVRMALYSDAGGSPGNLLAGTPATALVVGGQEIAVTQPAAIPPGSYWIMIVLDAETDIGANDGAPEENVAKYRALDFAAALPSSFGAAIEEDSHTFDFWMKVIQ